MSQILLKLWLIGNRTSCRPIRSVIVRLVIKQIRLLLRGRRILFIGSLKVIFNATQRFNIVATLFRMVTTLVQHYFAVLGYFN